MKHVLLKVLLKLIIIIIIRKGIQAGGHGPKTGRGDVFVGSQTVKKIRIIKSVIRLNYF